MSTELAANSDDFLLKALKAAQDATLAPKAHCHKSPKRWLLIARHVVEDGMDVSAFLKTSGCTRNNYYDIKRFVETSDDYENIRAKAALDASTDYEMGVDLERKYSEQMHQKMDDGTLEIDAQGYAQINRGQSMKADRFQKFSGAATQHVIVEHKTTLDEAAAFALEAIKEAEVVDV
jgi:hypothetical protein